MSKQIINLDSNEFQPRHEYVLVSPKALPKEETTTGGIVISIKQNSVTDRPTSGIVISVGQDIEDIKEDDFIIWPSTDGLEMKFNDGEFLLLRYKSIIGSKK